MSEEIKNEMVNDALRLSDFFKVEFTLSIFGKTLIHWVYPPMRKKL